MTLQNFRPSDDELSRNIFMVIRAKLQPALLGKNKIFPAMKELILIFNTLSQANNHLIC